MKAYSDHRHPPSRCLARVLRLGIAARVVCRRVMRASLAAGFRWALGAEKPKASHPYPAEKDVKMEVKTVNEVKKVNEVKNEVKEGREVKEEGSTADLLEQAWCQHCQQHDFGRFCPKCGQCLVHEVVTPTGHWRLGSSDRLVGNVKVKQEDDQPDTQCPWNHCNPTGV
eukprot:Skav200677  [mRNA]  locus=scaffold1446:91241:100128:+ [translate_table: standard]